MLECRSILENEYYQNCTESSNECDLPTCLSINEEPNTENVEMPTLDPIRRGFRKVFHCLIH